MCGIWALLSKLALPLNDMGKFYNAFMKIKHRGPDYSSFDLIRDNCLIGFHRLAIMDLTADGNQPFKYVRSDGSCVYCICNGEIYDHEQIKKDYDIVTKSHSDCEIIIPLYEKIGVEKMVKLLGSEFAFIIVDISKDGHIRLTAARDPIGVRPLFYAVNDTDVCFSSEMKGLSDLYDKVYVFPPGHYMVCENDKMDLVPYYSYDYKVMDVVPEMEEIYAEIRKRFINSVRRRLVSDQPIGALLSGGFDSSLVVGVMKMLMPDKKFSVFTISFEGGTDLPYAQEVAKYLNLDHHIVNITEEEALSAIDETIKCTETYDITSVRCSTVQLLVAKYIKHNTNVRVLKMGEGSDEILSGYFYSRYSPTHQERFNDAIRLVKDIHMFDGLRTDRTVAFSGIEARIPFLDKDFVDYIFSLPYEMTAPVDGLEKALLRNAFAPLKIMPDNISKRPKNAFSDAVSSRERSWYQIIQERIDKLISDEEFNSEKNKFKHCKPFTKESYYYRKKFVEFFGPSETVSETIPYFWMPKWIKSDDPSARTIDSFKD